MNEKVSTLNIRSNQLDAYDLQNEKDLIVTIIDNLIYDISTNERLLTINHKIDYRKDNGKYIGGTIIDKTETKLTIKCDEDQSQIEIELKDEDKIRRIEKYESISLLKPHRFTDLKDEDYVDINTSFNKHTMALW